MTLRTSSGRRASLRARGVAVALIGALLGGVGMSAHASPAPPSAVIATVPAGSSPNHLAFDPVNGFIYVASSGSGTVTVIDQTTNTVVGTPIVLGGRPYSVEYNPNNGYLYVVDDADDTLTVIDGATRAVVGVPFRVGGSIPHGIAFNPNNGYLYVANLLSWTVTIIDSATNTLVGAPIRVGSFPSDIVFNPSNGNLYVTSGGDSTVWVIDGATNAVVGPPIPVGLGPSSATVDPNTGHVYVTNRLSNTVSVIEGDTNTVVGTPIPVGNGPTSSVFNPISGYVYVTNHLDGSLSVIDVVTNMIVGSTISLEPGAFGITVNTLNGLVYVTNQATGLLSVVGAPPTITSGPPVEGTAEAAYAFDVTASALPDRVTFAITNGDLPAGLTLDASTGRIAGTPTTAGDSTFTLSAANGASPNATATYTLTIRQPPAIAPTITTVALPDAVQGVSYDETIDATGTAPVTFALTEGALPDGLELDGETGRLTGIPTTPGLTSFTVSVVNAGGEDSREFQIRAHASSVAPEPTRDSSGTLARTGDPIDPLAGFGGAALVLLAGLALLTAGRKRPATARSAA